METNKVKFKARLMRGNAQEILGDEGRSLKQRYGEEKKEELKVERKSVSIIKMAWNMLLTITGICFASIGLFSIIDPTLRSCLVSVLRQFFVEAGLL